MQRKIAEEEKETGGGLDALNRLPILLLSSIQISVALDADGGWPQQVPDLDVSDVSLWPRMKLLIAACQIRTAVNAPFL